MPKTRAPDTAAVLLAAIAARPERRRELFAAALTGSGQSVIQAALNEDVALRVELKKALADLEGLDRSPWLVAYAKRCDLREAIPELLVIARADMGSKSQQAAQALLDLGDRAALDALATRVESQRWTTGESVRALFVLGDDAAFTRLSSDAIAGGIAGTTALWHLVSHPEVPARDPRWIDVAVAALQTAKGAEAARALLQKVLTPELRRAHFADTPAAVVSVAVSNEALTSAHAMIAKLFSKLPDFPAPPATTRGRLDALAEIIGRMPPVVRALHERLDGLDVAGDKSADRVVLYGTETILEAAHAWDREYDPHHTPSALVPAFCWPVAPDGFTKAGLSGGPDYGFELPSGEDDPTLFNAPKKPRYTQFVTRELKKAARDMTRAPRAQR